MLDLQPQPQQELAIHTIDRNVAVSAGAGSGKTRVLVERFVHILEAGRAQRVEAASILAITFTRKAAAEMKSRVRQLLTDKLADDVDGFWRAQLQSLERTQISTIHSLCSRILRENPVEAQLDPQFVVAEDYEGREFVEECIKKYLRRELASKNTALLQLVATYGVNGVQRQMSALVPQLADMMQEQDLAAAYRDAATGVQQTIDAMCLGVRQLAAEREALTKKGSKGRASLDELSSVVDDVIAGLRQEPPDTSLFDATVGSMRAQGALKEPLAELRAQRAALDFLAADEAAVPLAGAWQQVLQDFYTYAMQQKLEQDFLTFDDLEVLAVDLLEKNEEVRHKYQQRFRYIMVDEFQDTNDRQCQLIYLLCGDDKEKLQGEKLFVVGDPKQSIYRFRGADVSVFARVRREIEASGGEVIPLNKNFRSVDRVLDACNATFRVLLGEDSSRDVYFEALEHNKESEMIPQLLEIVYDKDSEAEIGKRDVEAMALAQKMRALHDEEQVAYADMAVLVRAMTHVDEITDALQNAGIPYAVIDGKGFYEQQEVLDLLNLCAALNNRHRSLELAGVLRSPYFGLDDATLTRLFLRDASCLWDALQQGDYAALEISAEQIPLVQRAADILADLSEYAALAALPEVWNTLWQKLHVEAVLSRQQHGANKLANAKKLRTLAQQYSVANTSQGQGTLAGWLEYTDKLRANEARETAANVTDNQDVVSIMTIHKSKGLEFKTIFLPMLDAGSVSDTDEIKYLPQLGLGIKAQVGNQLLVTSVLQSIREQNKLLEQAERIRQLYVAMTRAEERLILSGVTDGKDKKTKKELLEMNWLAQLQEIFADEGVSAVEVCRLEQDEILQHAVQNVQQQAEQPLTDEELQALAPLPSYAESGRLAFTASALQTYLHCPRQYFYQQVAALPAVEAEVQGAEGESAAAQLPAYVTGLIVHRALELYRGDSDAAFDKAVEEFAPCSDAHSAKQMFTNYLASSLYKNMRTGAQQEWRELNFLLPLQQEQGEDPLLIKGVIDYVTLKDGALQIVDYKTGKPPADGEVKLGYAYQLALYKAAAQQVLQKKVSVCELHYLQNLSTWQLDDAQDYLAQALTLCHDISSRKDEVDFSCNVSLAGCAVCPYNYICTQK